MNNLLTALFALAVAFVTGPAQAQPAAATPAAAASQAATPVAAQAGAPGAQTVKSLEAKVAMCIGCHGLPGYQASFPEVYKVPMILGQSPKYLAAALTAYKNGDRKHPTMRAISASISDQDIKDISDFLGSKGANGANGGSPLPDKLTRQPDAQVTALMKKAACTSCHGLNLSKPIDVYPKIAGQHGDYLFAALRAYKMENNPTVGRSHPVMGAIAKQFSNAELKALARYVSSLDSELRTMSEPRFR